MIDTWPMGLYLEAEEEHLHSLLNLAGIFQLNATVRLFAADRL